MNVKVNDNVLVIAGKDKGVQGKVLATSPKANTVVVEGVRIQKKHEKARKANETSKIVEVPGPIDASNVQVVCPVCGKATRVKHAVVDGKKVEYALAAQFSIKHIPRKQKLLQRKKHPRRERESALPRLRKRKQPKPRKTTNEVS